jgi:cyclopropane fatty-acyl-phospholipid synthase-like methyltransferase
MAHHPYDMPDEVFQQFSMTVKRPDLLGELRTISRSTFGFLNRYPHMVRYYLWIVEQLEDLKLGARVLDLGAGLCPVPIWLASRGHSLDCVDNNPTIRVLPVKDDWNEWGFFDYNQVHDGIKAIHCGISDFQGQDLYDVIYSITALQSLPRSEWEDCLHRAKYSLRPEGRLLLCVDIVRGTESIWNYDGEVEPLSEHGTLRDIENNLFELGYVVQHTKLLRDQTDSPSDLLCIACRV